MNSLSIIPVLSEKSYQLSLKRNCYVFSVSKNYNKIEITKTIEKNYNVEVKDVNITNLKGKKKRVMSITGKRQSNQFGYRNNTKRAFVYLKEGFKIPIFDAIEEETKKEEKAQKNFDKIAEKELKKSEKKPRKILGNRKSKEKE
jgi:large subunit ribosomal protein L23